MPPHTLVCAELGSFTAVAMAGASPSGISLPGVVTAGDKIKGLRQWASGRCLSADRAGVYSRTESGSGGRVRRVVREPAVNWVFPGRAGGVLWACAAIVDFRATSGPLTRLSRLFP